MKILIRDNAWVSVGVVLMIMCSSIYGNDGKTTERPIERGFALAIPNGVTVAEESPVEDFILYKFADSTGKLLLVAYLGNHPNALKAPQGANIHKSTISGVPVESVRWSGPNASKYADVRIRLHQQGWPCWLHFSYGPLGQVEASMAEQIAGSLHAYRQSSGS
jgi:hypothetical protein